MPDTIATYHFKPHRRGDTWDGLALTYTLDGQPIDLSGASIRLHLRRSANDGRVALSLSTDNSGILITDAAAGQFQMPAQIIDLPPHTYVHDLEITLSNGIRKTRMAGTWKITGDIAR